MVPTIKHINTKMNVSRVHIRYGLRATRYALRGNWSENRATTRSRQHATVFCDITLAARAPALAAIDATKKLKTTMICHGVH